MRKKLEVLGERDFKSLDLALSQQKEANAQTTTPGAPMRVVCTHHTPCPDHPSDHPSVHVWVLLNTPSGILSYSSIFPLSAVSSTFQALRKPCFTTLRRPPLIQSGSDSDACSKGTTPQKGQGWHTVAAPRVRLRRNRTRAREVRHRRQS